MLALRFTALDPISAIGGLFLLSCTTQPPGIDVVSLGGLYLCFYQCLTVYITIPMAKTAMK
jgi:hypothetical protein